MASENLAFVHSLPIPDKQCIFVDASHTLFWTGSLVLMAAVDQDDVLGSCDLVWEQDGLKDKCENL